MSMLAAKHAVSSKDSRINICVPLGESAGAQNL